MSEREQIQWHPAFASALRIEFEEELSNLEFEEEHLLSKKPRGSTLWTGISSLSSSSASPN